MASLINTTLRAFDQMLERTGGSLHISDGNQDKTGIDNPLSGLRIPDGRKLFEVSIYNLETRTKEINLCLFVNPTDIQFGQVYLANNAYTRIGYVNTLWGQQQMTVTANGKSAAFYILADNNQGGITNYYRRNSVAFKNLFTLMAIFKNNGAHFLSSTSDQSIFKDGSSRVINVLDAVRIDYDGSSYLGAFNTFVVNDNADKPFTLEYNFEFVVSDLITDRATSPIEGHIRKGNNANVTEPSFATQGFNTRFDEVVKMNAVELNEHFMMEDRPSLPGTGFHDNLRGQGSESSIYGSSNLNSKRRYKLNKYLNENPEVKAQTEVTAQQMGISPTQLQAIIHFESAGTWSPDVNNARSSAVGLGQWINASAVQMADELLSRGKINEYERNLIKGNPNQASALLITMFPEPAQQVELYDVYASVTRVSGGRTLKQAIQEAETAEDKFNTYMVGHFRPAYVGVDENTPFPKNVQTANPGIETPKDYTDKVSKIVKNMAQNEATDVTTRIPLKE